jgi:hypothetical protein
MVIHYRLICDCVPSSSLLTTRRDYGYGGGILTHHHTGMAGPRSRSHITTVSQSPVSLGVRSPSRTRDQFYIFLEIFFRQLRFCNFVALSLTRGRVCNLLVQLLLGIARAVTLRSKSRRTHDYILLSYLRLPQPGGPGSRIYIPQEQGGPGHWGISPGIDLCCS